MAPDLVLFDIDGTLVRKTGLWHRQSLCEAVRRVFGVEGTTEGIPVHGMLDPDILTLMLRAVGADDREIAASMPELVRAAEDFYLEHTPELPNCYCPGVPELLAIERARAENRIAPDARISLIGDAPQDVRAAKENGIQSIAVRTGVTPPGHLEACEPDHLLDDLTHLDLRIIHGPGRS